MIHIRTNRSETSTEILRVEEVAFIRGKIEDRKYKTQVFLKCGTIVHMNLNKEEFQSLKDSIYPPTQVEVCKNYNDKPAQTGLGPLFISSDKPPDESPRDIVDSMLDDLSDTEGK